MTAFFISLSNMSFTYIYLHMHIRKSPYVYMEISSSYHSTSSHLYPWVYVIFEIILRNSRKLRQCNLVSSHIFAKRRSKVNVFYTAIDIFSDVFFTVGFLSPIFSHITFNTGGKTLLTNDALGSQIQYEHQCLTLCVLTKAITKCIL